MWGRKGSSNGGHIEEAMRRPAGLHFLGDPEHEVIRCLYGRDKEGPCRCCHTQPSHQVDRQLTRHGAPTFTVRKED